MRDAMLHIRKDGKREKNDEWNIRLFPFRSHPLIKNSSGII